MLPAIEQRLERGRDARGAATGLMSFERLIAEASRRAGARIAAIERLALQCERTRPHGV
ncbi:MAG: hypothetical protein MZW92_27675 [Comamonadaceae bacterium]|nr:hypothetical protein [Comamonadaceae bacterium]